MKVLFAIAHLNKGGGQAVQVLQLVRRIAPKVDGELLVLRASGPSAITADDPEVRVVGDLRFPRGILDLRRAIRERIGTFDVLQAFDEVRIRSPRHGSPEPPRSSCVWAPTPSTISGAGTVAPAVGRPER